MEYKMLAAKEMKTQLPDGTEVVFETGRLAKQASGSAVVKIGDAFLLATVCFGPEKEGDFFPLTVEYREKAYAAGRLPGGYNKREAGRPSDDEILSARIIDRPIRPMFPDNFTREVQVIVNVLSADKKFAPDVFGVSAASLAIGLSELPFEEQVAAVRVAVIGDEYIVNPSYEQVSVADLDLVVAGTENSVCMVEGGAYEVSEDTMIKAITTGHEAIKVLCKAQAELVAQFAKQKMVLTPKNKGEVYEKLEATVKEVIFDELNEALHANMVKTQLYPKMAELSDKVCADPKILAIIGEGDEQDPALLADAKAIFSELERSTMRTMILNEGRRIDGRKTTEVRPIEIQLGVLPSAHGSGVFQRGETQALVTCTLGTKADEQRYETLQGEGSKSYMLHYNFPPFCVGECKKLGMSRREIGHGHLAERSLKAVLPVTEDFPYTIRIVSEILESNGSSSMASVCGGTLSLMDAGVPIKAPVAGVAMGLISETGHADDEKIKILTDITGTEDHLGDMDFKVTGTEEGITAFQMDIKIKGITPELMRKALDQAREGRLHILSKIKEAIPAPRDHLSPKAPTMLKMRIPTSKIRDVIGSGGAVIKGMQAQTGCQINIDESGMIDIAAPNAKAGAVCRRMIEELTAEPEPGRIYKGKVKTIQPFGAFVEILPGRDGLVHISELADYRVEKVEDIVHVGDEVTVLCLGVDPKGKVKLSIKALQHKDQPAAEQAQGEAPVAEQPQA
ncbi:polyribonucleotide nucleotidyltransferase [Hallerella succinigenes]|uniref:Polyribonucleotide nucleotidyltransferase n=1 Tax=Hallerella succinigenes TaxID=1896222 RepID=A0A2M9AA50_9BACT|nr:polyribonucleotide nucleotidyltransferase [Hallerella succinigenes]MDD6091871.1 polyribonucleotide nucleotidyltransferase [Hallerella succinigenes]MDY5028866.1 polyribonucleotide nucleotidyltransferase [Hallerella succinigenes]PJJ42606.1 polyribonucleotide nucleotidyltransferase [Hallerella succinigenes]